VITLDALGKTKEALELWEESVVFGETMLPPADESSVVMSIQAALCFMCLAHWQLFKTKGAYVPCTLAII
jgi:hypothetical protein